MPFVIILCDSETAYYENLVVARTYDLWLQEEQKTLLLLNVKTESGNLSRASTGVPLPPSPQ